MSHAFLSPSAAERWLHCPCAPRIEATLPDNESEFAAEGTRAHEACANLLKGQPAAYDNDEMKECANTYYNIVMGLYKTRKAKDAQLMIERPLNLEPYIPGGFGTADCIIIDDGLCHIVDFKYGRGVKVSAENNPQLMIYALGALMEFTDYAISKFALTIVQPRMANLSQWFVTKEQLIHWTAVNLLPGVMRISTDNKAHCGSWCKFCKALSSCTEVSRIVKELPPEVDTSYLSKLPIIRNWCDAVEAAATEQAIAGKEFTGYKLTRAVTRAKVNDEQGLIRYLGSKGYAKSDYIKESLKPIKELRKLPEDWSKWLIRPEGKLVLKCE